MFTQIIHKHLFCVIVALNLLERVVYLPAKSKKQFGKMGALYREGKISKKTLEEFNKGVSPKKLPTRVKKKK